jgi:integrase
MRLVLELKHLKWPKGGGNAKYRRRVPNELQVIFGVAAVEWSLGTKDPMQVFKPYSEAHERFEAKAKRYEGVSKNQMDWDITHRAAVEHGLARPDATRIGPINPETAGGMFNAFTDAIRAEAKKLTHNQMNVPYANSPPDTPFELLTKGQLFGIERPPVRLHAVAKSYLKNREQRSSYRNLEKNAWLTIKGLEDSMGRTDPSLSDIQREQAYAYSESLLERGNKISTIERRITTIKAILNHGDKRFPIADWRNPFNGLELPQDDGTAGSAKRLSLTLDDIRQAAPIMQELNSDARDVWHLMMFTGAGPNEIRGLLWDEVVLDHETPHFKIKGNAKRRLKTGERVRSVPLVGSALVAVRTRRREVPEGATTVFPRYSDKPDSNTLSAVLIKAMKRAGVWEKELKVPYSLRHSIKDWLRRVAPTNINLLLMGHGHGEGRVAGGYGGDDLLDEQAKYLTKALQHGGVLSYPVL